MPMFYVYEKEMGRPLPEKFPARRVRHPCADVVDNTEYDVLRPGVMVSYGRATHTEPEYLTSSGVLIQDHIGHKYLTVASHGFPYGDSVFHPSTYRKEIGKIIMKVTHTNIALVRLHENISFVNEAFESIVDGTGAVLFSELASMNDIQIGATIYMNNPFTGYSEGTCGAMAWIRVPSDDTDVPRLGWVKTRWSYLGQGFLEQLEDGVCGSAIWSGNGRILGFFDDADIWTFQGLVHVGCVRDTRLLLNECQKKHEV